MAIINGRGRVGIRRPSAVATPSIVLDGLKLYLDAGNATSYAGTGTVWTDISGNGNNGTLVNSGSGLSYDSANGGYLQFDGLNDYVVNTNLPSFNVGCIDIWIKSNSAINSASAFGCLIQLKYGTAVNSSWFITLGSATSLLSNEYITIANVSNDQRTGVVDGGSLLANTWYNLVFNWEANQYKIYINNSVKTTATFAGGVSQLTTPNRYYIGAIDGEGYPVRSFFSGAVAGMKMYNRTLTSAELLQNYNAALSRFYPIVSDADAQAFVVAAGLTSSVQANAVNTLVTSMKTAGVWTKMKAVYPMVGGSAAAHKWNLKDPRDLNAAYRLAFAGTGWVHSSTGAKPNGSSDYANTFLNASGVLTIANNHISFYSITNPTTINSVEMGASDIFGYYGPHIRIRLNGFYGYTNTLMYTSGNTNNYAYTLSTNTDARGHFIGNILSTTNRKTYKNGNVSGVNTSNISQTLYNGFIYLGALNNINTAAFYTNRECAFATIGDGLTDAEASSLYTAVQTYQTALGRQV